jgi:hypothetical protein
MTRRTDVMRLGVDGLFFAAAALFMAEVKA